MPHSSIVFYLEMKVKVDVVVQDIGSRFTPRGHLNLIKTTYATFKDMTYKWGLTETPQGDCNTVVQTVEHLVK